VQSLHKLSATRTGTGNGSRSPQLRIRWLMDPRSVFRVVLLVSFLAGCATLPPGSDFPKTRSVSLNALKGIGLPFDPGQHQAGDKSGFRIVSIGVDGFLMRMEMINAAKRTLDLQYYIFRSDETGRLLTVALTRAADRGVRVRVLVDDGDTIPGDEQLIAIARHANIEIRIFNPFDYRGYNRLLRDTDYLLHHPRLDYRMHNKLLVADNSMAIVGGRNIGDQYFQIDPDSQFADDDVYVTGPIVPALSGTFDNFWNSVLAIPAESLPASKPYGRRNSAHADKVEKAGFNYQTKLQTGEPLASLISGRVPLVWARAQLVCDSPEKKRVLEGSSVGSLMYEPVAMAVRAVQSELLMVTPYFIPSNDELRSLETLRKYDTRVRVLTNSLESTPTLPAHSGYMRYRKKLLQNGIELHEVRSLLGSSRGSGESTHLARFGNYALHAKLYVFDRQRLFIGSMNFDQRSSRLNTEVGLIIDSPELSQQIADRFEAMVKPENSYTVGFRPGAPHSTHLVWRTVEAGSPVEYDTEPSRNTWRKFKVKLLSIFPLDSEL
jgi:cardiolipin synthase C